MQITVEVDQSADAAYLRLSGAAVASTAEVDEGVFVDLDEHRMVVGVELLGLDIEIPFQKLIDEFQVPSHAVELLRRLHPNITQSVLRSANDGIVSAIHPAGTFEIA